MEAAVGKGGLVEHRKGGYQVGIEVHCKHRAEL